MHTVVVHIHVKEKNVEEFIRFTLENVIASRKESGVVRFDFFQEKENQDCFLLIEIYQTPEDQVSHRQTSHYLKWKDAVEFMMLEPRRGEKYNNLLALDKGKE